MISVAPARFATHPRLAALLLALVAACLAGVAARAVADVSIGVTATLFRADFESSGGGAGATGAAYVLPEPTGAAAFVAAYARGSEADAERAASPLYAAEWARRGGSLEHRETYLHSSSPSPDGWLRFTYQTGMADRGGFEHLLYTVEPVAGPPIPAVWRIDTAPDGRVIWSEPVWFFARPVSLVRVAALPDVASLSIGQGLAASSPAWTMGIRAADTPEGYYMAGVPAAHDTGRGAAKATPASVRLFAVDDCGQVRPSAWSYGEPRPGLLEYGKFSDPPALALLASERALRDAYVARL